MIRGENGGLLRQLFLFHDTARSHRERRAIDDAIPIYRLRFRRVTVC